MFEILRADARRLRETKSKSFPWYVVESLAFDAGYQAVLLHRCAHWFKRRRIPLFGPALARTNQFLTGADIAPAAELGPGLRIAHPAGIVIGHRVVVGRDCLVMQNVTLGAPTTARIDEMPAIGDRVTLGAGCAVVGPVRVGDDAFVGALALVTRDVPPGSKVIAAAGIEIRPRGVSAGVSGEAAGAALASGERG
jgi:serine O-acetyltransferase